MVSKIIEKMEQDQWEFDIETYERMKTWLTGSPRFVELVKARMAEIESKYPHVKLNKKKTGVHQR